MYIYQVIPSKRSAAPPPLSSPLQKEPTITFIEHTFQNILRRKKKMYRANFFFFKCQKFFWKIVEKYDQKFSFRPISRKTFFGTNQTILRRKSFTHKKMKIFDEKMFEKVSEKMLSHFLIFFLVLWAGGFAPPTRPTGAAPWIPHAFGLRTLVGTGLRSTAFQ